MSRDIFFRKRETPIQQEKNLAKKIKGRRESRSGAYRKSGGGSGGSGHRGDVLAKDFAIECKQTDAKSMSIKIEWLEKISKGARPRNKKPALEIMFNNIDIICSNKWILIEEEVFLELLNAER